MAPSKKGRGETVNEDRPLNQEIVVDGITFVKIYQKMFRDPNNETIWVLDVRYEQKEEQ